MRGSVRRMLASAAAALGFLAVLGVTGPVSAAFVHGGGGFHGGFARGFGGTHLHALMAGRHWDYYRSNGRFGTGWGRHGGYAAARFLPAPEGFAGSGADWSGRRFAGNRAVWAGYGRYYTDYDGLWGGDIVGLEGLAAGISIGGDDCLIYAPFYDNLDQYLHVEPVDRCAI